MRVAHQDWRGLDRESSVAWFVEWELTKAAESAPDKTARAVGVLTEILVKRGLIDNVDLAEVTGTKYFQLIHDDHDQAP